MLKKFSYIVIFLSFAAFICPQILEAHYRGIFKRVKPTVYLMPVIDSPQFEFPWITEGELPWSVSEELTYYLRDQFAQYGQFFMISENEVGNSEFELGPEIDYFCDNLEFATGIDNADFMVIVKILNERLVPYKERRYHFDYHYGMLPLNWVLKLDAKFRIIDLRKDVPRLIIDKLFCRNHLYPRRHDIVINYEEEGWGTDCYPCTPLGLMHRRFAIDLAREIQCIIWKAR